MEKIITESIIKDLVKEISEEIAEQGFDNINPINTPPATGEPSHGAYNQTAINTQGDTNTTDIAQQANKQNLAINAISLSLPYMIGYVQPLNGPAGFVFGCKQRGDTSVVHPVIQGTPTVPESASDEIITRKLIQTEIREVTLDFTNEAATDIEQLFGNNFGVSFERFQQSGGEIWDGPNGPLAKFFLYIGMQRMTAKINKDFTDWLEEVATFKGTVDIPTYDRMANIYGAIGELRESLFKATGKSGSYWIMVTPKIAAFLSSTLGSTMNNSSDVFNKGRRKPKNTENGYVMTMGDIDVYQYDFYKETINVTGGTSADSEDTGEIFMGFKGGPNVSSVYYMPYNEYIVQGGEDYSTGQSNVYYRVRDAWSTNPLDTYDETQSTPILPDGSTPDITKNNKSQYIVKCAVTFGEKIIN